MTGETVYCPFRFLMTGTETRDSSFGEPNFRTEPEAFFVMSGSHSGGRRKTQQPLERAGL